MPLNRRDLRSGESPFRFRNQDAAKNREELADKTKGKYRDLENYLKGRTKGLRPREK
jgi:hypothetical protein